MYRGLGQGLRRLGAGGESGLAQEAVDEAVLPLLNRSGRMYVSTVETQCRHGSVNVLVAIPRWRPPSRPDPGEDVSVKRAHESPKLEVWRPRKLATGPPARSPAYTAEANATIASAQRAACIHPALTESPD